jgi:carboxypeptidase-like protein/TonB-dependent receptor-like protein
VHFQKSSIAFLISFFSLASLHSVAQKTATIYGTVKNKSGNSISEVNVSVFGEPGAATTDGKGNYTLSVPAEKEIIVIFSYVGFKTEQIPVTLSANEKRELNKSMTLTPADLPPVYIIDEKSRQEGLTRIDIKSISQLPTASGNFEDVLKTLPGVISNNELSSAYSVRGGNYDENLVYVNDIEIYRPFLVRSGQQEGLSFINSDLVSNILFSPGGFDAVYGDKMSSVLDIKYRKPTSFGGSFNASLLGGGVHLEGLSKNKKFTFLAGIRYKSNQYLLKTLDTKGEYKPSFGDGQAYLTYKLSEKTEIAFLGNYSKNKYRVVPVNRQTDFGNINQALRLTVYFDGQEVDEYTTEMGALSLTHYVNKKLKLKLISSVFHTVESEKFDILGQYYLDELERDIGSDQFAEVAFNRGIGSYLDHARNSLDGIVYNVEHKGSYTDSSSVLQWGIKLQHEDILDKLSEWKYVDSSGYSLPHPRDSVGLAGPYLQNITLQNLLKTRIGVVSNRYSAYLEDNWTLGAEKRVTLTAGIRATYWDLNRDIVGGPRVSFSYKPKWKKQHNFVFRAATGFYYQPPFYRELRDQDGKINSNLKAQRSIHFVAGSDYQFLAWGREFKFVSEIYYKMLDDLVPYKIENLRIRYFANNNSKGYARGIDLRVNGEFIEKTESWISMSILQTKEDIIGDYYYDKYNSDGEKIITGYTFDQVATDSIRHEPGYIARPTDQRVTFSMFFQDYLPKFPSYKMHLSLIYGTGLPFGPPGRNRYKDIFRFPDYRRVDIGFSKTFIDEDRPKKHRLKFANHIKSLWVSLEVFNLLQVSNTVSYLWIADITNRYYAVPEYLSARTINLRLNVRF